MRALDLAGKKFGKWTALRRAAAIQKENRGVVWEVVCDCGNPGRVLASSLSAGASKCCGRCRDPEVPDVVLEDLPVPRFDYGAVIDAVARYRVRRPHRSIDQVCRELGIAQWDYYLARRHVATDKEAFDGAEYG